MVIPNEWHKTTIGELADIYNGGTPSTSIQSYWNGDVLWCTPTDITQNKTKYIENTERTISLEGLCNSSAMLMPAGTILLCSRATIGEICIAGNEIATNQGFKNLISKENTDNEYLYYLLQTKKRNMLEVAIGSTFLEISKTELSNIEVCVPKEKTEQHCIAQVLSDTESYISALEKLIEKKRLIKQGAMQELLTGKRRLPGFSGEWKKKNNIFNFKKGEQRSALDSGKYPLYNGGQEKSGYSEEANCRNSITISEGGNSCGFVNYINSDFWAGGHCYIIDDGDFNKQYLYNLLKFYEPAIMSLRVGSGLPNIQAKSLKALEFLYPLDEKEQSAIAEILSDMDAEIDALTEKLNKVKLIKQGMMQKLLTGEIRLVETEAVSAPAVEVLQKADKATKSKGHNEQIDDAVMIAAIVNALYTGKYPLGRKKVQKCLYLLRRHKNESTAEFKKKAAGPYADEIRYKGGEPIAKENGYIETTTTDKGTIFSKGKNINKALQLVSKWARQNDIKWLVDNFKYKKVDELELLATVDMAICDLLEVGTEISVNSIKNLIATNKEWKAKLKKQNFSDKNIADAIKELKSLL
jgi:type I restriction enzyme S subunit